ncbi:unnamed protein product [Urochloa humidicola]
MASPGPSSPPPIRSTRRRAPSTAAASDAGVLPADLLFDVLLRLPAKELCRLRAVCRAWRALTADPLFAGAHASLHRGPSLLAKFRGDEAWIHVVDLRGVVLKRMPCPGGGGGGGHELLCTRLDLLCVASKDNSCHVLNPATGAAYALPESPAPEHAGRENSRDPYTFFASGRVAATGECKVLRVFNRTEFDAFDQQQLFEVFTINGARWRARESHYLFLEANNAAVVGGVVYFLTDCAYDLMLFFGVNTGVHPDCIASFDLGTEEWRRDIQGPISSSLSMDDANATEEYRSIWHKLTLSELKGSLVLAYHRRHLSLDLWLLIDFENGLWVKEYSIRTESAIPADEYFVKPLLVSDDGRLVILLASTGLLLIYDPRTSTFTEVEIGRLDAVGIYTGNLLSLQGGDMV